MLYDRLESILGLLEPFNHPDIPLTSNALRHLNYNDLNEFYDFLIIPLKKHQKGISRPECPVKNVKNSSLARLPYKTNMANYIAEWGYDFKTPVMITTSLLEATANFLEEDKLLKN